MASVPESRYINRELSWLDFDARVLEEAERSDNPLFERLKFLSITASNLDEFFMVRVAGLRQQAEAGFMGADPAGMTPREQLRAVSERCHELVRAQYACWSRLLQELGGVDVAFLREKDLSEKQAAWLDRYFTEVVYPVLTPLAVDAARPFPRVTGKRLTLAVRLRRTGAEEDCDYFALVQVPPILNRTVELPSEEGRRFMLLEDIILRRLPDLFAGYRMEGACLFRVTRDADLSIDEDAADLMVEIQKSILQRKWGHPVRLEVMTGFIGDRPDRVTMDLLVEWLGVGKRDIYTVAGPLDLTLLMGLVRLEGFDALRDEPWPPLPPADLKEDEDIFEAIRSRDLLIHHPYESFDRVIDFVRRAAEDPHVLAIKQTLYRVSGQSPIVTALIRAAENGKQVTALVELKARFDEENNIAWARRLEQSGCHVIYGMAGLKVHCKALLVVRREEDGIRRYVHLSTGNYNDATARLYSDMGLFTCREAFGADVSALFNLLTGYSAPPRFRKLAVAPIGLRDFFDRQIGKEIRLAAEGRPARIIAKVNSLIDPGVIEKLYEASAAGVRVDLIVRGVCGLRPGVPGLSDNIRVVSIVGRFLEHHRIFYFSEGGRPAVYLSSADWMSRNMDRRVEVCFPVEQPNLRQRLIDLLDLMLSDNRQARLHLPDGRYVPVPVRGPEVSAQRTLYGQVRAHWEEQRRQPPAFRPKLSQREEEARDGNGDAGQNPA